MNSQQEKIIKRYITRKVNTFKQLEKCYEQVYLYMLNKSQNNEHEEGSWKDVNVEGKLYIFRSTDSPGPFLLILNKKNLNDFCIELKRGFRAEVLNNFIIIGQSSKDEHFGIWFANPEESRDAYEFLNS